MGYWKEKQKYEESKTKRRMITEYSVPKLNNCTWCGATLKDHYAYIICQKHHFLNLRRCLCEKCAKKCPKCDKFFCPKHIKNHKCVKK